MFIESHTVREGGASLARANTKLFSNGKKKNKRQKLNAVAESQTEEGENNVNDNEEMFISLYHSDVQVNDELPNIEAWIEGAVMKIKEEQFFVELNPPSVIKIELPGNIMIGFPVTPHYQLEFTNDEPPVMTWFREKINSEKDGGGCDTEASSSSSKGKQKKRVLSTEWTEIHTGSFYIPTKDDIGCRLKVSCTPMMDDKAGNMVAVESTCTVNAGPGLCPFERRHIYTQKMSEPNSFRIVSYNILANYYADSDFSRDYLFAYCPNYALQIDYRKQLFLKEIAGYNADIICLQEVDNKVYENDMRSMFHEKGFDSHIKLKAGSCPEGCVTLHRKSKFSFVANHDIELMSHLETSDTLKDLHEKVCSNELLKDKVMSRGSILQVIVLKSEENPGKLVVVATTHLYFHPKAANVRLIQMATCVSHLEDVLRLHTHQGEKPALILCGDLNSVPDYGVYKFLTERHVSESYADWYCGGLQEYVKGMELNHQHNLESACGTPKYTNYVGGFNGCLDYIFIDSNQLKTTQVIPLPSEEEVTQFTALPSVVFPSDHLALVCDLTWQPQHQTS